MAPALVLVVDDEPDVCRTIAATLQRTGRYSVVTACGAEEALALIDRRADIAVLLTDVVLGHAQDGYRLAARARERRPGLKVLFTSGYVSRSIASSAQVPAPILKKPFDRARLEAALEAVLNQQP